jgi:hypothetical protein
LRENAFIRSRVKARHWWLTTVILATWEAAIRRTVVQSQPEANTEKKAIRVKGWTYQSNPTSLYL